MAKLDVINLENKKIGSIDLRDDVFAVDVNVALVHQVLKAQLAGRRQGTAKTKTKSEVRGGGRKPFKQKGTGNARQGSTRSPLNPGGGQSFGPQPRCYDQATPKEMMRGALRSALSDRVKAKRVLVMDEFKLENVKTKVFNEILKKKLQLDKVLIVDDANTNLELSGRNIPKVKVLRTEGINVYDIVKHEWVVFSKRAVQAIETRLAPNS
ncbi:MAG TPA: 50S ribosomal protein L4 [Bdellovibrionales bacterium]|nr:MAG: 50S ribosomal protein L4 [Bdellovibrionales bacterium GWB1_52_6]OFZ02601.1 MAG: 50S ribosomal protein L4 [Bdellovibrionales bacterium GWA1_52_35]OFZ41794.1 MAG: 50S ribosomal protein L4 [Bdellovibrionales bacterium GWC1_52_8]HAR43514.1 50S ribosomal protein L4 [Bdellovibrionales bacterium]HCM41455.1 50S ribosomal protein L4 [Bdellovibrionales bacterium]